MKDLINNSSLWRKAGAIALCCGACATAQASLNISSLNTGASATAGLDDNWTVSASPAGPGNFTGPASATVVTDDGNFPFNGYWLHSTASSWISYSSPLNIGGDTTGATFDYRLSFTALSSGDVTINFASDNSSQLFINNALVGGNSSATAYSAFATANYSFIAGNNYTIDFDVLNIPQDSGNPTGANVEFSGDVKVSPVPETTTIVAGALLLLPLGASALRGFRKNRIA